MLKHSTRGVQRMKGGGVVLHTASKHPGLRMIVPDFLPVTHSEVWVANGGSRCSSRYQKPEASKSRRFFFNGALVCLFVFKSFG